MSQFQDLGRCAKYKLTRKTISGFAIGRVNYPLSSCSDGWREFGSRRIALQSGDLNLSYTEATGCLLLLLASESARRKASEGQVWSAVRGRFAERPSRILFVQGQPREIFKVAIEAAARKLGLRHVFGIEGTQNYYLQRVPSIRIHAEGNGKAGTLARGPTLHSGDYVSPGRSGVNEWLRSPLSDCGKPCETTAGTTSPNLGLARSWLKIPGCCRIGRMSYSGKRGGTRNLVRQTKDKRTSVNRLLRNLWTIRACGGFGRRRRCSRVQWSISPTLTLTSERYQVKIGSGTLTTLVAADDGVYSSHPQQVALPSGSPEFVVSMVDDNGVAQASQLLELWDGNEDVEPFDLQTGRRLNAYSTQLAPSKVYGLLASSDLGIEPSDLPFHEMGAGSNAKRLYLLPSGNERPVRVTLAGEEIWSSSIEGGALPKPPEPDWAGDGNDRDYANGSYRAGPV